MAEEIKKINVEKMYKSIDKMVSKQTYVAPSPDYFPTKEEVVTMIGESPYTSIPFLTWLNDSLSKDGFKKHSESVKTFLKLSDPYLE